jgi:CMP-N,N'-diacetyllegionaminic acid synthase
MIGGRRVLVVVPARGGSKGLPRKNLRLLLGTPLVAHVGALVRQLPEVDQAVVSTDDDEIAEAAVASGLSAPFRRPEGLSGDRVGDREVLEHALLECEKCDGQRYDVVLMLQPTSPLRRADEVRRCALMLVEGGWDSVWTVSPTDSKAHPLKQLNLRDGRLSYYDERGRAVVARQELSTVYHRNGNAYALTRRCLLEQRSTLGERAGALVSPETAFSIDTDWDLELVEFLLERRRRGRS